MMSTFWKTISSNPAPEPVFRAGGRDVPLKVVRSARARSMTLRVERSGSHIRLTLPPRAPLRSALAWAETKRDWVEAQLAKLPAPQVIAPGMIVPLGDTPLRLDWHESRPRRFIVDGEALLAGGPLDTLPARLLRWLKEQARAELTRKTQQYAAQAGVNVPRVGLGDPVSRWGSCAADGTIRYSWRLILTPGFVQDATVAHEVAHRLHMDHSPAFHAAHAKLLGSDPKPARRWLAAHGAQVQGFGRG